MKSYKKKLESIKKIIDQDNFDQAEKLLKGIIKTYDDYRGYELIGYLYIKKNELENAINNFLTAIDRGCKNIKIYYTLGTAYLMINRCKEGIRWLEKYTETEKRSEEAYINLGIAYIQIEELNLALNSFKRAEEINCNHEVLFNIGRIYDENKNYLEAMEYYKKAINTDPKFLPAYINLGIDYQITGELKKALDTFIHVINKIDFVNWQAWSNKGNIERILRRFKDSLESNKKSIEIKNTSFGWLNLGNTYADLNDDKNALNCYQKALDIDNKNYDIYIGISNLYQRKKNYGLALKSLKEIVDFNTHEFLGRLIHLKMICCDWDGLNALKIELQKELYAKNSNIIDPFGLQAIESNENNLFNCAKKYTQRYYGSISMGDFIEQMVEEKINIGYVSGEFKEHATSLLIIGLLESHNKKNFRIFGFNNSGLDDSDTSIRLKKVFTSIEGIQNLSDQEALKVIKDKNIHILVNLNGFFGAARTGIFALRAAPIQVNYLGFPGTMGADFMDYIIADKIVIPESSKHYYSEKIVYLPDTYQVNDSQRHISSRIFSRAELGLPEDVFVFCCFNNNYKITPEVFDSWCRVLQEIEGSVLWLLEDNQWAKENLIKEFLNRGLSESRLIFAKRMDPADHLARHSAADLFLDTLPYNAHTTASDALWMGLPLLTQVGTTFPGRVAASLLTAIDLPELITTSQAEYENRAIELATNPELLEKIRQKLNLNKFIKPLFDTNRFTENIENAYIEMYRRYKEKLPLGSIEVSNSK